MSIDLLFQPFEVRNLRLDNRFVMSAMSYYKNPGQVPNAEFVEYHRLRASGGIALVLTGATAIDRPAANNHPNLANISKPTVDAWRTVVDAVHASGRPIAMQLWHAGALFNVAPGWEPAPLESPSGLVEPGHTVGAPLTEEQIADCIDAFGRAAALAIEAGFDAVEIHGAHGFLIDEFFWDATNLRHDAWGGPTITERSRFAVEVVRAVRAAIGHDTALLMKVSQWKEQDYHTKIARTPAELVEWLGPLADAGVDVFDCSQRRFWQPEFDGSDMNFAGWVRRELGVPTITIGSVGLSNDVMSYFDGEVSEHRPIDELVRRFERGDFDLVALGRIALNDPTWVDRLRTGATDGDPMDPADLDLGLG